MRYAKCERDPDVGPTIESHAGGSSGRMHVVNMGMVHGMELTDIGRETERKRVTLGMTGAAAFVSRLTRQMRERKGQFIGRN